MVSADLQWPSNDVIVPVQKKGGVFILNMPFYGTTLSSSRLDFWRIFLLCISSLISSQVLSKVFWKFKIWLGRCIPNCQNMWDVIGFSNAFNKSSHNLLTHKLNYYGIQGIANTWIHNFLSNRTQAVLLEGKASNCIISLRLGFRRNFCLGWRYRQNNCLPDKEAGQIGPKQNRPQVKSAPVKSAPVKSAPDQIIVLLCFFI